MAITVVLRSSQAHPCSNVTHISRMGKTLVTPDYRPTRHSISDQPGEKMLGINNR